MKQKTEASQAVDARNAVIDECIAALTVHLSHTWRPNVTVRNAIFGCREVVAALKAQPAPTEPQDEKKPFAWAYRAIGSGDWRATMDYKWAHAIEGMETKPLYDFPTEAALPTRHALQAEGKHPAPCARHCEATAFGIEIRRLTAENAQLRAAQGEDSARLDAAQDVLAERRRQVEAECWTTEQDDEYRFGELAKAAICYVRGNRYVGAIDKPIDTWPFNHDWWKPTTDRRNLVKAVALIIAEIERIDRARASAETGGVKS